MAQQRAKGREAGAGSAGKKGYRGGQPTCQTEPQEHYSQQTGFESSPQGPGLNFLTQGVAIAALAGSWSCIQQVPNTGLCLHQDSVHPRGLSCFICWPRFVPFLRLLVALHAPTPTGHPILKEARGSLEFKGGSPRGVPSQGSKDRGKEGSEPAATLPHPGRVSSGTSWED